MCNAGKLNQIKLGLRFHMCIHRVLALQLSTGLGRGKRLFLSDHQK